jgi:S-adenosylmethionine synthetase
MTGHIVVRHARHGWIEALPVEIVERKGIGHPDSLCDGMAERISVAYTRWCRHHLGVALHHNFDKVQLVAGATSVSFGGGRMLKPIRVQIAGRAAARGPGGEAVPVDLIAIDAAKSYLRDTMRHLDPERHCVVDCFAGAGAAELVETVRQATANDTSIGVAHWPLSRLEQTVLETTMALNGALLNTFPIGEDAKVMGIRRAERIGLTCAVPLLATEVGSRAQYRETKATLREALVNQARSVAGMPVAVDLNMADNENSVYLTLTGTSAECGDDGAVGRGNRVTGLITPFRASSMEAAAGKNPISHVGKLYNLLALRAAKAIVGTLSEVREAEVALVGQIGLRLETPLIVQARVNLGTGALTGELAAAIEGVVLEQLEQLDRLRDDLLAGKLSVF